jgi:cytochrome c biogenesis protein CcdA
VDFMGFMEAMGTSNIPLIAAFFIGLMTAISPCPLATNITAIAYISKKIDAGRHSLLVGFIYTLGRTAAYVLVASAIVWLGLSSQSLSVFLQQNGEILLGPFLLAIGILMLAADRLPTFGGSRRLDGFEKKLGEKGYLGGFLLGFIFALSFCPFSAVLFFGMLIPLALAAGDPVILPTVFAAATGLPVILFAFALTKSMGKAAELTNRVQAFETFMKKAAAAVFIIIGLYYTLSMI